MTESPQNRHDRLDDAIDFAAARMTHVSEDAELASRIANALPDHRPGLSWMLAGWAPRMAAGVLGVALIAGVLSLGALRTVEDDSSKDQRIEMVHIPVVDPQSSRKAVAGPSATNLTASAKPSHAVRRNVAARPPAASRTTVADHEYSLPALDEPAVLALGEVMPNSLPASAPLLVTPLEIADLPAITESLFQR